MPGELDEAESRAVMGNAADVRPFENVHNAAHLHERSPRKAGELTREESAAILSLAANVRPDENFHPED